MLLPVILITTRRPTMKRSHINAWSVERVLGRMVILIPTRGSMQKRNHMNALSVERLLGRVLILPPIRGSIQCHIEIHIISSNHGSLQLLSRRKLVFCLVQMSLLVLLIFPELSSLLKKQNEAIFLFCLMEFELYAYFSRFAFLHFVIPSFLQSPMRHHSSIHLSLMVPCFEVKFLKLP
uniref:Uncharacterized protein n=1 Tax=Micrurus lemniscatus lemniscatus TaxID=129467 RepID=A0A2D4JQ65_MICLE